MYLYAEVKAQTNVHFVRHVAEQDVLKQIKLNDIKWYV